MKEFAAMLAETPIRRQVQRSSFAIYADGVFRPVDETAPTRALGVGDLHAQAEQLATDHRDRGGPAVDLRLDRIYDANDPKNRRLVQLAQRGLATVPWFRPRLCSYHPPQRCRRSIRLRPRRSAWCLQASS